MTLDAHKDRTELRLRLYQNGFTPLANKSKMCLLPEWSTFKVDPERIQSREWARSKSFSDTGIRCGDVTALDWDIDDKDLLNDLLDAVVEQGIVEESPFVRIGRPPRELWVYRTSEKIGKRTTGHFMPPGAGEDHKGFAVEILGAGCQFAAFGQRDENTAYQWPEESLLDHQYMDLPEITHAQVDALRDFCSAFFESRGLERRSPGGGTDSGYSHAYDLTPDMVFDVQDMGPMTVAEIGEALRLSPNDVLRCKVDALRPTTGSWAGMISLVNGEVCVSDHGTYTSHFPTSADAEAALSKLGALLAQRFPEAVEPPAAEPEAITFDTESVMDPQRPLDDNLAIALKRFVYSGDGNTIHAVDRPMIGMTADHFRTKMRPFYEVRLGPKGGEVRTWLADLWLDSHDRIAVASIAMRPDQPWPIFRENGTVHLNTYRPPVRVRGGGDPRPGFAFLEHLLPVAGEREYFIRWLSNKYQHPEVRGAGIIMVAHDRYGTGRGTLVKLLRAMFSDALVQSVDFKTLSGQTYQSQYNEWLVDSLIVAVDEAQEVATTVTKWQARSNAYEHLKSVVEPSNTQVNVVRKGVRNSQSKTFASIIVMTNHSDALILPTGDRRFAIMENGGTKPQEYWDAFHAWLGQPANVSAFIDELVQVPLGNYSAFEPPPMTAAKAEMVESGSSELDRALEAAMAGLANTLIVKEQIILRVEDYLADNNVEVPDDWQKMIERMLFRKTRKVPAGAPDRVRIDNKQRAVRCIGTVEAGTFASADLMIDNILTSGPLTRPIRTSGQIVKFPSRG